MSPSITKTAFRSGRFVAATSAAAVIALAGSAAQAQCPAVWTLSSPGQPTNVNDPGIRQNHAAAFDSARNLVMIFGGYLGGVGFYGDTWGWSGEGWTQLSTTGPTARGNMGMAFDTARGKLVLFGGAGAGGATFGDTWEWDGSTWTQLNPTASPPGRFNHAMAYDSARGVMVVTGGFATSRFSDTWEFDGTTWTQRSGTTYGARSSHGMAFDASRNKMVIYGGFNGTRLNDTREYDSATGNWSQSPATGPTTPGTGRQYLGMDYDSDQQLVVLFGGQFNTGSGDRLNDTWAFNGTAWTQLSAGTPPPDPVPSGQPNRRDQHTITYDRTNHRMVLFGGYQGATFGGVAGDTWTTSCPVNTCYANCDGSTIAPILNVNDFICFQSRFAAGDSYANCDGSTVAPVLNVNDFICFQSSFAAGCR